MKYILSGILTLSIMFGICGAYFEEKLFCDVGEDYVQVSIKNTNKYHCMDYVRTLEYTIKITYKDLLIIQDYITRGQDIEYRSMVRDQKRIAIDDLQNLRANILIRLSTFEHNLFVKVKEYMLFYLKPYQIFLQERYNLFQNIDDPASDISQSLLNYIDSVKEQLDMIEQIILAVDLDELVHYLPNFFYLKNNIDKK